jgi:hypothetical protein
VFLTVLSRSVQTQWAPQAAESQKSLWSGPCEDHVGTDPFSHQPWRCKLFWGKQQAEIVSYQNMANNNDNHEQIRDYAYIYMCAHAHGYTQACACMRACMNLLPSFWFQSYTNNHYLSCKTAFLPFHYILFMQQATILATIHDVLQMLHRMSQYEEGFFRTIS